MYDWYILSNFWWVLRITVEEEIYDNCILGYTFLIYKFPSVIPRIVMLFYSNINVGSKEIYTVKKVIITWTFKID